MQKSHRRNRTDGFSASAGDLSVPTNHTLLKILKFFVVNREHLLGSTLLCISEGAGLCLFFGKDLPRCRCFARRWSASRMGERSRRTALVPAGDNGLQVADKTEQGIALSKELI